MAGRATGIAGGSAVGGVTLGEISVNGREAIRAALEPVPDWVVAWAVSIVFVLVACLVDGIVSKFMSTRRRLSAPS